MDTCFVSARIFHRVVRRSIAFVLPALSRLRRVCRPGERPWQMDLPDRIKLPLSFDPAALALDLSRIVRDTGWTGHHVTSNYDGEWSGIPLRAPAGETHPIRQLACLPEASKFVDTPYLAMAPYIRQAVDAFRCDLANVRLLRLTPGSRIKPHRDLDLDPGLGLARLHIPILTNASVEFLLEGRAVVMAPGECWSLQLCREHSAYNGGTTDRVHLVLDARVDAWLMDLRLLHSAAPNAAPTPRMMATWRYFRAELVEEIAAGFGWDSD